MEIVVLILQIIASVISFISKVMIYYGKRSGWLVGVIASTSAFAYFYLIQLYVYTTMQAGLFALMSYGFLKKDKKSPRVEMAIRIITIIVMCIIAYLAWRGALTTMEFVSSVGLIFGTYLMTHGYMKGGWFLYGVGHSIGAYFGYIKEQPFLCFFQVASVGVSIAGMRKKEK